MNKLFELKFGSHLYGTNTENSDTDLKSIYLPDARQIVLGTYQKTISTTRPKSTGERNNKDDIDIEIFSLDRYLKLLAEGQTVALDILFAPPESFKRFEPKYFRIFQHVYSNKEKLICKDITAFFGYARQQAAKYGLKGFRVAAYRDVLEFLEGFDTPHVKLQEHRPTLMKFVYERPCANPTPKNKYITVEALPDKAGSTIEYLKVCDKYYQLNTKITDIKHSIQTKFDEYGKRALQAEKNEGIDWKALSHAVRVNSQGVELLTTGKITFPRPDRDLLLKIKTGQLPYKEVEEIILEGFTTLEAAKEKSTLRDKPDQEWIDNFVVDVYTRVVKGEL